MSMGLAARAATAAGLASAARANASVSESVDGACAERPQVNNAAATVVNGAVRVREKARRRGVISSVTSLLSLLQTDEHVMTDSDRQSPVIEMRHTAAEASRQDADPVSRGRAQRRPIHCQRTAGGRVRR